LRLAFESWGEEGNPLAVLVHGVTASSRTWWRVGPWFAENGWRVVAVDLRGHGSSPRIRGGEGIEDLAKDVHDTAAEVLEPGERMDVLLGHSLGALAALKFCELHGDRVRRVVLEDPPGPESTNFEEVARGVETNAARAQQDPDALTREWIAEKPSWAEEDAANGVLGLRKCDAGPVAELIRGGLRYDLVALTKAVEAPTLLVLGSEEHDSALIGTERAFVTNALRRGMTEAFDAGHGVHRDNFEGYVRLLGDWLGGPAHRDPG
jgi:pimeloyl-ACP methyl ester carboxylesterase